MNGLVEQLLKLLGEKIEQVEASVKPLGEKVERLENTVKRQEKELQELKAKLNDNEDYMEMLEREDKMTPNKCKEIIIDKLKNEWFEEDEDITIHRAYKDGRYIKVEGGSKRGNFSTKIKVSMAKFSNQNSWFALSEKDVNDKTSANIYIFATSIIEEERLEFLVFKDVELKELIKKCKKNADKKGKLHFQFRFNFDEHNEVEEVCEVRPGEVEVDVLSHHNNFNAIVEFMR